MNKLFGATMLENNFKHEKRFLISTLILFSLSYLVSVVRNLAIFYFLENEEENTDSRLHEIWCSSNFNISLFNIGCYIVTELIPYLIIFILNFNNFRTIGKQDNFTKSRKKQRFVQQLMEGEYMNNSFNPDISTDSEESKNLHQTETEVVFFSHSSSPFT